MSGALQGMGCALRALRPDQRERFVQASALILGLALALAGCSAPRGESGAAVLGAAAAGAVAALPAAELPAYLAAHDSTLVLDVRSPQEWDDDLGHINGAVQIPIDELPGRLAELEPYRDRPVVAVCRVGVRSARAADLLAQSGFRNVSNLEGGMAAYRAAGY